MRTNTIALVGLTMILVGCGGRGAAVPSLTPLAADAVILSYAAGPTKEADLFRDASVDEILGASLGRRAVHRGVPGESSESARLRLSEVLDEVKPGLVVIGYGAADLLQRKDPAGVKADVAAMIDLARDRHVQVVLLGMPNLAAGISLEADPLYAELAREKGVPIENEALSKVLSKRSLKAYTMVPNEQGIAQLGQAVRDLLVKSGALPPGS